ncbi:MAG: flagellar biosynthesis protein FlhB [Candidatus Margulisiibacteriota bacterium]|nr:MAG: flagellar biosynthesis protein FlhB [Candidatus Margulisbacteria bacterium GWD2_39_127]OGI05202.1 MAG: flagellar biosynthesis protein FlhB [Candidatus Margulisbacteria bacterium GWF2_38_17]OGI06251.1 MAG: flagellar biosynthesis protein FlhB [Candidatus Margulisbacteria bacterium GWE2_39_32]PZM78907.1 MAG: flagellar biosynthesis protein FlhB [Candidatus Margulisiibacteriota bacterium]HAR64509.1 flagellar biosynthesis protein FlhB [Candidatus Margulisiibacteriota bacterium]
MADPSKTENATPRRKQDARKKGQVAKSSEISATITFVAALLLLKFFGRGIMDQLKNYLQYILSHLHEMDFTHQNVLAYEMDAFIKMAVILLPFMLIIALAAVGVNYAQIGFFFSFEPIKPSFNKINPFTGFARIFSKRGLEMLVKSLLKIVVISWIVYGVIKKAIPDLIPLIDSDLTSAFFTIADVCYQISLRVAIFFIIISIADYYWQRHTHEESLKMSKQEVKDESKRTEGNPQIKGEIRRRMRQMMRSRMMTSVPKADVVVTNPTHIAVALLYDADNMVAPKVVAKGAQLIAEQIKDLAKESGVPIIENKPLARTLFKTVEIGEEIPQDLFNAVAEILTYVNKLTGKTFGL